MAKDPWHYPRTALADQYLKTLAIGLSKSLVLFAQRRMGKTEFLRKDLLPAAEKAGYITIYVSLWESREDPQSVLLDAIRKAAEGEGIISGVWRRLGRPGSKIGVGANASTVGVQASWEQGTARGQRPHAGSPTVDEHAGREEKAYAAARGRNSDAGGREAVRRTGGRSEERPRQAWRPN